MDSGPLQNHPILKSLTGDRVVQQKRLICNSHTLNLNTFCGGSQARKNNFTNLRETIRKRLCSGLMVNAGTKWFCHWLDVEGLRAASHRWQHDDVLQIRSGTFVHSIIHTHIRGPAVWGGFRNKVFISESVCVSVGRINGRLIVCPQKKIKSLAR